MRTFSAAMVVSTALAMACSPVEESVSSLPAASSAADARPPAAADRPSILLVTLDTTRADVLGYAGGAASTPTLDRLASRGVRFDQAYTTAPTTLPAHASMLTGRYPADHGVHENARTLSDQHPLLAEKLAAAGYSTAAFVSGFPLDRRFGLGRGFDRYDDDLESSGVERRAGATTDRALAALAEPGDDPLFLWVHYFDPHEPYDPPPSTGSGSSADPYLGEITYMDAELGRLLEAFEARAQRAKAGHRIVVVGDHGEGRGDHGEAFHGNLLYQGVMRVPLVIAGSEIEPRVVARPVSTRRVFDTVLAWAGIDAHQGDEREGDSSSLLDTDDAENEAVLGEAMKPFLQYGWQPQVMAVHDRYKVIRSGDLEVYDVIADPAEANDLAGDVDLDRTLREALRAYPFLPTSTSAGGEAALSTEDRARLAALGYAGWDGAPAALRDDAPSPKDMAHLFADLDLGSGLFVRGRYAAAIEVFDGVLERDPHNLMVALRLAAAHSALGDDVEAEALFARARAIDPTSVDVRHYHAMHLMRVGRLVDAEPLLESVVAEMPDRLAALEALATIRAAQGRPAAAIDLLERVVAVKSKPTSELIRLGALAMSIGDTARAIDAFERTRDLQGDAFGHHLELGVLYLDAGRLTEARDALDQVPPFSPGYAMALFKRAQVSVLLDEPDRQARIADARKHADPVTHRLIEDEALFRRP